MNDVHGQVVWERRIRRSLQRRGLCVFCKVRGFQDGRLPPPRHGRDLGVGAPPSCIGHLHPNNDENSRDSVEDFVSVTADSLVHGPTVQLLQPAAYVFASIQPRNVTDTLSMAYHSSLDLPVTLLEFQKQRNQAGRDSHRHHPRQCRPVCSGQLAQSEISSIQCDHRYERCSFFWKGARSNSRQINSDHHRRSHHRSQSVCLQL